MSSWADFERAASEFAAAGRRLLVGSDGTAIAFLATVAAAVVSLAGQARGYRSDHDLYPEIR